MEKIEMFDYKRNYTVIDTEYVTHNSSKIFIQLSALKIRDCQPVEYFDSLVNPLVDIPKDHISGIKNEDVENQPLIDDIIDHFITFIGDDLLVGSNVKSADISAIKKYRNFNPSEVIDTVSYAKKCCPNLDGYGIHSLAKHFHMGEEKHRSLDDCFMTYNIFEILQHISFQNCYYPCEQSKQTESKPKKNNIDFSNLNIGRYSFFDDCNCEKILTNKYANYKIMFTKHTDKIGDYPYIGKYMKSLGIKRENLYEDVRKIDDLDLVVYGSESGKEKKARKYGIKTMNLDEFYDFLKNELQNQCL